GLVFGECQFAEARPRAGAEEADVVGDLVQSRGRGVDGTVGKYHRIMRRQCLELVWCRGEGNSGDLGDAFGYFFGKAHWRIKPGANCGAALRQFLEAGQGQLDTLYRGGDLRSIAGKFLAKGEGSGVLRMRTPDLDDVVKRLGLGV